MAFRLRRAACLVALLVAVVALEAGTVPHQAQARTVRRNRYPGWSSNGPLGGEIRVLAVDPSSSLNVYAGTAQGVMKSTDGGATWLVANRGIGKDVVASIVIDRSNPRTIYAATWDGAFKSHDAGSNWQRCGFTGSPVASLVADPDDPHVLYAAGAREVYRTVDAGRTWSSMSTGIPDLGLPTAIAVSATKPRQLYVGVAGYGVFARGRKAWRRTGIASSEFGNGIDVLSLVADPLDGNTVYASMFDGLSKSTDAGRTWQKVSSGLEATDVYSLAIDPTRSATLYAGTLKGIYKSTDGASSWTATALQAPLVRFHVEEPDKPDTLPFLFVPLAIDPSLPQTLYAAPGRGTPSGVYAHGPDVDNLVGQIFKSTDAGVTWVRQISPSGNIVLAIAVDAQRPATLHAGTPAGVYSSHDGGMSWLRSGLVDERVEALAVELSGTMYAGLRGSGIFKSNDGGITWSAARDGLSGQHVMSLKADPTRPGIVYAGTPSGIFNSTDGAGHWHLLRTAQSVYAVEIGARPQTLYAGVHGGLLKSTDDGNEWRDTELKCAAHAIVALGSDTLYAGTHRSVFKSTDGGSTWQPANQGMERAFVHALLADPADPNTIYAGSVSMFDSGGVFKSTNAGMSWNRIGERDVNQLIFSVAGPRMLYAATYGNGVTALAVEPTKATHLLSAPASSAQSTEYLSASR